MSKTTDTTSAGSKRTRRPRSSASTATKVSRKRVSSAAKQEEVDNKSIKKRSTSRSTGSKTSSHRTKKTLDTDSRSGYKGTDIREDAIGDSFGETDQVVPTRRAPTVGTIQNETDRPPSVWSQLPMSLYLVSGSCCVLLVVGFVIGLSDRGQIDVQAVAAERSARLSQENNGATTEEASTQTVSVPVANQANRPRLRPALGEERQGSGVLQEEVQTSTSTPALTESDTATSSATTSPSTNELTDVSDNNEEDLSSENESDDQNENEDEVQDEEDALLIL